MKRLIKALEAKWYWTTITMQVLLKLIKARDLYVDEKDLCQPDQGKLQ